MTKYSIIIPAYNAEATLARCLDSILSQDRTDIRVLLIDDGSTDSTGTIARSYQQSNPRVEYHRQENSGVSAARNRGLELARSEFVSFVDSDDYVMPNYFSVLDTMGDADLLVFDRCHIGGSLRDDSEIFCRLSGLDSTEQKLELLMYSKKIMQPVNKCFRLDRIRKLGLQFPRELHIAEDFVFCTAYAVGCNTLAVSREQPYCVDVSDGSSLSRRYRPDLARQLFRAAELVSAVIESGPSERKDRLMAQLDRLHSRNMLMSIAEEFKICPLPRRSRVKEICCLFRKKYSLIRLGKQHAALRLMLTLRLYGCLTALAWTAKGWSYRRTAKEARHGPHQNSHHSRRHGCGRH